MTEAELQTFVLAMARARGVLVYHTHDSRRSEPGFPDLVLVGAYGVLWRELKTEKGRPSVDQLRWIAVLTDAGQDVGIWRPSQWPEVIDSEMKALGRVRIHRPRPTQEELRAVLRK